MSQLDFDKIDAAVGNTLVVFADLSDATAYCIHQHERGVFGIICRVEDTRTGSGLVVQWRDPIRAAELPRRQREALWLLEEVIAGRVPRPEPGKIADITPEVRERIRATDE
jgi:hypothetical protein